MKPLALLSLAAFTFMTFGCGDSPAQAKKYGNYELQEAVPVQSQNKTDDADKIVMHTVMNNKTGRPMMYIPLPSSWKMIENATLGEPGLTGPNGLNLTFYAAQSYIYTNDPMMNQSYQSSGMQVMAPAGIDNVLNQVIMPQGQQMGMTFIKKYPLPEIAANDREYSTKLNGGDSPNNIFEAIGSEWKDNEGNKALVVIHYNELNQNGSVFWGYTPEMLKVKSSSFEKGKQQYIYAMANKVFDQNDIARFQTQLSANIREQEAHATAMRNIISKGSKERLANDAATNEYVRNTNKAAAENRAHNNDLLQEQINHALTDIKVVISPFDGKEYQVEAGNKTYWINDEGKYIKSDDPLFDPNKYEDRMGVWKKAPFKVYE